MRRSTRKAAEPISRNNNDAKGEKGIEAETQAVVVNIVAQPGLRRSRRAAGRATDVNEEQHQQSVPVEDAVTEDAEDDAEGDDGSSEEDEEADDEQGSSEEEAEELDVFDDSTREVVDAFEAAIADPAAFLRPSSEISELARKAAKVKQAAWHTWTILSHYIRKWPFSTALNHLVQA